MKRKDNRLKAKTLVFTGVVVSMLLIWASLIMADEDSTFNELKRRYSKTTTMEATFKQRLYVSSLNKERMFEGEFFYKRGRGFLWQYRTPKSRFFLYDGRYIYQGDETKPYIIRQRVDKRKTAGTFLDLIDDIERLDDHFDLQRQGTKGDMEFLVLMPKQKEEGQIKHAVLWVDGSKRVRRLELYEFTGNNNIIEFSNIRLNEPLDDAMFILKPDRSKEVIDSNHLP